MNHLKNFLFLSILCSLVLFTNCGEDSDDPLCEACPPDDTNTDDDNTSDDNTDDYQIQMMEPQKHQYT